MSLLFLRWFPVEGFLMYRVAWGGEQRRFFCLCGFVGV